MASPAPCADDQFTEPRWYAVVTAQVVGASAAFVATRGVTAASGDGAMSDELPLVAAEDYYRAGAIEFRSYPTVPPGLDLIDDAFA
jgi:hypothetical protein